MPKILRKNQKIFANAAVNNGVFGSAQAGTNVLSSDIDTIQSLAAYNNGWLNATNGATKRPALEEFQALQYMMTSQIAYLLQEGIAEWNTSAIYYVNSIVKKAGTYELYGSLVNDNTGNALPNQVDNASWKYLGDLANLVNAGTIPDATTSVKGKVQLADQAAMEAQTVGRAVTADVLKFAPAATKAWVNFKGTGTVTIRASFGVSSITDLGTGQYQVNWSTSFSSVNYCVTYSGAIGTTIGTSSNSMTAITEYTAAAVKIGTYGVSTFADHETVCVAAHGDL